MISRSFLIILSIFLSTISTATIPLPISLVTTENVIPTSHPQQTTILVEITQVEPSLVIQHNVTPPGWLEIAGIVLAILGPVLYGVQCMYRKYLKKDNGRSVDYAYDAAAQVLRKAGLTNKRPNLVEVLLKLYDTYYLNEFLFVGRYEAVSRIMDIIHLVVQTEGGWDYGLEDRLITQLRSLDLEDANADLATVLQGTQDMLPKRSRSSIWRLYL